MTLISRLPFPPVGRRKRAGPDCPPCRGQPVLLRTDVRVARNPQDRRRAGGSGPRAAGIMGIAFDALAAMGFADAGIEPFLGHGVPRQSAVRHIMRVCPACLSEAPLPPAVSGTHVQIDACPIHRLKLLDRCPACQVGGRIRWGRNVLLVGECGHDLSGQLAEPAGDCVGCRPPCIAAAASPATGPDLPAPFADLPLQDPYRRAVLPRSRRTSSSRRATRTALHRERCGRREPSWTQAPGSPSAGRGRSTISPGASGGPTPGRRVLCCNTATCTASS